MRLRGSGLIPGLVIAAVIVLADQFTKRWAEHALTQFAPVEVTRFFNLSLVYNPGAAFSFLADAGDWGRWLLTAIAVVIGLLIVGWLARLPRNAWWSVVALGLVLGGAIGNLIDRLRLGAVVDFLDFHWAGYHWPAFNVADMAIVVGAVTLIVATFIEGDRSHPATHRE
ncbi:signal peptidase II [Thioalkalivibrio sp. ALJ16]|uniref:signal peptidase II n=1 Tax=Thioalkalivibrio sp. ALJ16 TaxID=1158762 RepID=UPI0003763D88|nr:signal peptidase II [Thioalkalivibrio sp. ALJ16]